jgi:hypothetical protein
MAKKLIQRHFLNPRVPDRDGSPVDYAYGSLAVKDVLPFLQRAGESGSGPSSRIGRDFVVIFGNAGVRWIVPSSSHSCLQILSSWRPYNLAARVKWQVIEIMSYVSLLRYLPDTECFTFPTSQLSAYLRKLGLPEDLTPVIQVGNPSRTRKITLFLLKGSSVCAVIKVPLTKDAVTAVADEAKTLRAMSALQPAIPEFICYDSSSGWSVQNWVHGSPSSRKFTSRHREFLLQLVLPGSSISLKSALRKNSLIQEGAMRPSADKRRLEAAFEEMSNTCPLPQTMVHGDFTPWNIKIIDGKLRIVDWESAQLKGLPLQDICHFFYRQDYLFGEAKDLPAILLRHPEVERYLAELSISRISALRLILYYLVDTYCQHLSNGEDATYNYVLQQIDAVIEEIKKATP